METTELPALPELPDARVTGYTVWQHHTGVITEAATFADKATADAYARYLNRHHRVRWYEVRRSWEFG